MLQPGDSRKAWQLRGRACANERRRIHRRRRKPIRVNVHHTALGPLDDFGANPTLSSRYLVKPQAACIKVGEIRENPHSSLQLLL